MPTLGPAGTKFLNETRGIGVETLSRYGVYTASRSEAGAVEPAEGGQIIVFPFVERGAVVAEKYRGRGKQFWQKTGGRRTFWNADALDDPSLEQGHAALVITEGEIDALTAIDCGFPLSVSVPDGAPPVPEGMLPGDLAPIDPSAEGSGKFEFLWNNREKLRRIKRFILAVDSDAPGQRLQAELVRRLSPSRCCFAVYPDGCKDLNEVLLAYGPEAVAACLNAARPFPVKGLYRLSEYPDLPAIPTFNTGWPILDDHLKLFAGEFMVVTGVPGHGKSAWVDNLVVNLASTYGWRTAIFSPEEPTVPHHRDKFRRIVMRKHNNAMTRDDIDAADTWIDRYLLFVDNDPSGQGDDADFSLDWVIERATDAVMRDGIRLLVVDPWNEVEHARERGESMSDYVARGIRALKRFARLYGVAVIVVAHPTKDVVDRQGKPREVNLYDIADSAHWFNKADHGVIVSRSDAEKGIGRVRIAKVKHEGTGERGEVRLAFDRPTSRFDMLELPEADLLST